MKKIRTYFHRLNTIKIAKIVIGATLAILVASFFDLQYYTAAGIITILTIYDTKKETILVAARRMISFSIMVLIVVAVFSVFGYSTWSFGIFLLFFITISYIFRLFDHISVNSVLATHFLVEGNVEMGLILNELYLMVIGVGIGILLNFITINQTKAIRKDQSFIEDSMKEILLMLASRLDGQQKDALEKITELKQYIKKAIKVASDNHENYILSDRSYYLQYMLMRNNQVAILENMSLQIDRLGNLPLQAQDLASFFHHVSTKFHEYNNAIGLLEDYAKLKDQYRKDVLPHTREEFENRAILFQILSSMEQFLIVKRDFARLYEKEIALYSNQSSIY